MRERTRKILELYAEGKSIREIATEMCSTYGTISSLVRSHTKEKKSAPKKIKQTPQQIKERAARLIAEHRDIAIIRSKVAEGVSKRVVADMYNLCYGYFLVYCKLFPIEVKPKHKVRTQDGKLHHVFSCRSFSKQNNLRAATFQKLLKGEIKFHRGFYNDRHYKQLITADRAPVLD